MTTPIPVQLDQVTGSTLAATRALRYTRTAVWLHWTIAGLMLITLPLGLYSANVESELAQQLTNIHKLIGILVLVLTVGRIGWRLRNPPPALPEQMSRTLRTLARATHALFYFLLLALPLSGWWMTSAFPGRHPIGIASVLEIPFLPIAPNMASAGAAHELHGVLGYVAIALIALHVAAALKHHFMDRDQVLRRMLGIAAKGPVSGRQSALDAGSVID